MATKKSALRAAPLWAVALLLGALMAATVVLVLSGAARAQPTGSADQGVSAIRGAP